MFHRAGRQVLRHRTRRPMLGRARWIMLRGAGRPMRPRTRRPMPDRAGRPMPHRSWRPVPDRAGWPVPDRTWRPVSRGPRRPMRAIAVMAHRRPMRAVAVVAILRAVRRPAGVAFIRRVAGLVDRDRRRRHHRHEAVRLRLAEFIDRDVADLGGVIARQLFVDDGAICIYVDVRVDKVGLIETDILRGIVRRRLQFRIGRGRRQFGI